MRPDARRTRAGRATPLSSEYNTADGRIVAHPKGVPQKRQDGVGVLAKGTTIACAPRLVLALLGGSERSFNSDVVH